MQVPQLSIGIVLHNELRHLPRLLENIEAIVGPEEADLIFVDNASSDGSLEFIERWSSYQKNRRVQIVARLSNHLARARNDVLEKARTPWVFFWDADCGMSFESWQNHLEVLRSDVLTSDIVAVGGGNKARGKDSLVVSGLEGMSRNWLAHMGSLQLRQPRDFSVVNVLSGCNMLIRTKAANIAGGCNTDFHPVGEDLSLCYRLRRNGGLLLAAPHLEVDHYQNPHLRYWLKKIFAYGRAQILVGRAYPEHFYGIRGLQLLGVCSLTFASFWYPLIVVAIFATYSITYWLLAFSSSRANLTQTSCGWILSSLSHLAYAAGELFELTCWFCSKIFPISLLRFHNAKE